MKKFNKGKKVTIEHYESENEDNKDQIISQTEQIKKKKEDINQEEIKPTTTINTDFRFELKNGRVGQEYSDELDFNKMIFSGKINRIFVDGLDQVGGLQFNEEKKMIQGAPVNAGKPEENYEFTIEFRVETDKEQVEKREVSIKILPDPKFLWKEIEPEDKSDPKDHNYSKILKFKESSGNVDKEKVRTIVAASKRGRSQAHKGSYRADHVVIEHLYDNGWSVLAVADGAVAKLSRVGSHIACEKSVDIIKANIDTINEKVLINSLKSHNKNNVEKMLNNILCKAAFEAIKAIQVEATKRKMTTRDFHTTLLLAIYKDLQVGKFFAGFWVGDGALAIYDDNKKKVNPLGISDGGEVGGAAKFITENEIMNYEIKLYHHVSYHYCNDFTALFAMTDGVSDPKLTKNYNLFDVSNWEKLWEEIEDNVLKKGNNYDFNLLDWLDFWSEGSHDDRTIAILF